MTWQIAFVLGLGATAGLGVLLLALVPGRSNLQGAVDRVDGRTGVPELSSEPGLSLDALADWLGAWMLPRLSERKIPGLLPSKHDLAITDTSMVSHLGQRAVAALVGALVGPVASGVLGFSVGTSVGAALVFAVLAYAYMGRSLTAQAAKQREQFSEAAVVYLELMAIARLSGAGAAQSMQDATEVADHPGLKRIHGVLAHARWTGVSAWQALADESVRLALPEMGAIADITRSAGEDETEIYANLRARAASMRNARVNVIRQGAKRATTMITLPVTGLLLVFAVALGYPFLQGMNL
ncbi:hypothetical protein [Pseudactinotalea sp. Z1748]|uniref:hypothetical protein n=1 Tax=Pseudactinotalea sp. Z1748 TaxID=3413027 RepID=UPI003C7DB165